MRRQTAGLIVAALALAGAVVIPATAQMVQAAPAPGPSAIAPGAYSLTNALTAKNLHVAGVSIDAGTTIVQDSPRTTAGQSWWVAQSASGLYKLRNTNSGLCLQDAAAAGGSLKQEDCAEVPSQGWRMTAENGGYSLVNAASGRAADAADAAATEVLSNPAGPAESQHWKLSANSLTRVTAWGTALTDGGPALTNKTVRMVVRPNAAGNAQRMTLSNRFGTAPLVIASATVGYQGSGLNTSGAPLSVKFGGQSSVTIPAGAEVVSDALNLPVKTDTNLVVSLFVSGTIPVSSYHNLGIVSNGIADGNHAADTAGTSFSQGVSQFYFLKGIDVISATTKGSMVALGDSITDGWGSTNNGFNDWPAQLADRINARDKSIAMVNAGISSNRLTFDAGGARSRGMAATTRFAYDVAAVPGVTSVFLFEGINDIPDDASADRLIEGYRNIIAQARAAGLKVYGATMTPTKGVASYNDARELVRTTANNWIMTSGEFDGVADFSAAVADPADPQRILPIYDSGDKIHLSVAGYAALARAVDVVPFTQPYTPQATGPEGAVEAGNAALLSGSGFAAGEDVVLTGECLASTVTVRANSAGSFASELPIDAECATGTINVVATGQISQVAVPVEISVNAVLVTPSPTIESTDEPITEPTVEPTDEPTMVPTVEPTMGPSEMPTTEPTFEPTDDPTAARAETMVPTETPTPSGNAALAATGASAQLALLVGGAMLILGLGGVAALRRKGQRV